MAETGCPRDTAGRGRSREKERKRTQEIREKYALEKRKEKTNRAGETSCWMSSPITWY
jgi:hypothetical protein